MYMISLHVSQSHQTGFAISGQIPMVDEKMHNGQILTMQFIQQSYKLHKTKANVVRDKAA